MDKQYISCAFYWARSHHPVIFVVIVNMRHVLNFTQIHIIFWLIFVTMGDD